MPQRIVRSAVVAVVTLALVFLALPLHAQPGGPPVETVRGRHAVAGEVLVKFRHGIQVPPGQILQQEDIDTVEPLGTGTVRLRSRSKSVHGLLTSLGARGDVDYVEPNYIVHTMAPLVPNDPSFGQLWGLQNTGQSIGGVTGTPGADIRAAEVWGMNIKGSTAHVVGVVDTGVNYNHEDLAANMWSAPSSFTVTIAGQSITCAQGTRGFNAINNTCDPMDDNNHGSHVAGTIGAVGNNGKGVAGVNWTASMLGLKFLASNGSGSTSNAVKLIDFAVQVKQKGLANVRVLSNSWGGGGFSQTLLNAIQLANTNGILFVAAAGNNATNIDSSPSYPASYNAANVVAVAATDNRDNLASFSNYGATSVELGAPGVNVVSTTITGYASFSGTSMATPHVSGAAALVLAACPTLNTAGIITALTSSVDPVTALAGKTQTGGRLNVHKAVQSCATTTPVPDFTVGASPSSQSVVPGGVAATYTVTTTSLNGFNSTVTLNVSGVPSGATWGFSPNPVAAGTGSTLTITPGASTPTGNYTLTITGTSGEMIRSTTVTLAIRDFSVTVLPSPQTVAAGTTATFTVNTAALNGFTGNISLAFSGQPAGSSVTLGSSSVAVGSSTSLTVANAPTGTHVLTITGTSGTRTKQVTATLIVNPPVTGSFGVAASPSSRTVSGGSSTTYTVTVALSSGFTGPVALSATGLPSGASATFSPSSFAASGTSTMTIATKGFTAPGTYTVTIKGTSGSVNAQTTVTLVVCKGSACNK